MPLLARAVDLARPAIHGLDSLAPVADLGVRLWAAKFFWDSALTKINVDASFPFIHMNSTTILLFQSEYQVPLLAPAAAAYLGTAVELVFPVLLALGLGGRLAAFVLFAFNIVAVISYPGLEEFGLAQHQLYGTLLLVPLLRGPGRLSFDHWLRRRWLG